VVAVAEVGKLEPTRLPTTGRTLGEARKSPRRVDYATEGVHDAQVYVGELLEPGMRFDGPAIVETRGSTIVVHPGNEAAVDPYGNVIITLAGEHEQEVVAP
jgi:N-methylhydantoinase A